MFPHRNIHKYTWTSPDGKTHKQIDHTFINKGWHLSILDVRSFWGADYDTDHCLVVAKFRKILAVSKDAAQNFDMERFNLRKLNELEFRKQYQIEISKRFTVLENLSGSEDINGVGRTLKRISKSQLKKVYFFTNLSNICYDLIKNV